VGIRGVLLSGDDRAVKTDCLWLVASVCMLGGDVNQPDIVGIVNLTWNGDGDEGISESGTEVIEQLKVLLKAFVGLKGSEEGHCEVLSSFANGSIINGHHCH